jgi:hypothetical protein
MATTYDSKYASGAAVDAALDLAGTAVQPLDLGTAAMAATTDFAAASKFIAGAGALTGPAAPLTIGTAASAATTDFAPSNKAVLSDTTGVTGADRVTNIISLTQAEYDAITPDAATVYVITDENRVYLGANCISDFDEID